MTQLTLRAIREHVGSLREFEHAKAARELIDEQNSKHELDRRLDQALEETFPASDPVSIMVAS